MGGELHLPLFFLLLLQQVLLDLAVVLCLLVFHLEGLYHVAFFLVVLPQAESYPVVLCPTLVSLGVLFLEMLFPEVQFWATLLLVVHCLLLVCLAALFLVLFLLELSLVLVLLVLPQRSEVVFHLLVDMLLSKVPMEESLTYQLAIKG